MEGADLPGGGAGEHLRRFHFTKHETMSLTLT
jgi:hypothetical protein